MLSYYYALLRKKQEEVRRLQACQEGLQQKQQEFHKHAPKCIEPELTQRTWHGRHANDFDDIRVAGIDDAYKEIAGPQFANVFQAVTDKLTSLQEEIETIQRAIVSILAAQAEALKG